jgi:phospholipase C
LKAILTEVTGEPLEICAHPYEEEVPLKDPDHAFAGTSYEIYQKWDPTKDDVPNMKGFIERQSEKYNATPGDTAFVIRAYNQKETSVLADIAQNFAFWDSYVCYGPSNLSGHYANLVISSTPSIQVCTPIVQIHV